MNGYITSSFNEKTIIIILIAIFAVVAAAGVYLVRQKGFFLKPSAPEEVIPQPPELPD